jgi:hypothetical protein
LPQIHILDGFAVGCLPTLFLPVGDPFGNAVLHIGAVRVKADFDRAFDRLDRLDGGGHFHTVVGGIGLATPEFPFRVAPTQERAPASRPGIAATGAIGVNVNAIVVAVWFIHGAF